MATKNQNPAPADMSEIEALLAELAAAENYAEALTPKPRTRGPKKIRTYFDTAGILAAANALGPLADYLDLLDALGIDEDGTDDKGTPIGPKIRTRLSQLTNARRDGHPISIGENFAPIKPQDKPLYLARKNAAQIAAKLAALGYEAPTTADDADGPEKGA